MDNDLREKLIELIHKARLSMWGKNGLSNELARNSYIADYLIENGVTVQEWIPVTERLPEKDNPVCICTDNRFVYAGVLIGDTWFLDNDSWTETVTHWMPLPEPPETED